jgi:hypothetical protein
MKIRISITMLIIIAGFTTAFSQTQKMPKPNTTQPPAQLKTPIAPPTITVPKATKTQQNLPPKPVLTQKPPLPVQPTNTNTKK